MGKLTKVRHPTEWKPHEVERFIFTTHWRIPPPNYVMNNSREDNPIIEIAGCNLAFYGFTLSLNQLPGASGQTSVRGYRVDDRPDFFCERNGYMVGGLCSITENEKQRNRLSDGSLIKEAKIAQLKMSIVGYVMESFRWHCARYPREYGTLPESYWRVRCMKETWNEFWIPVHGVQFFDEGDK
jgi:hypothetical protein